MEVRYIHMAYYNEKIDVRGDGRIILYKRLNRQGVISPTWFMRISLPLSKSKGYFQATTKETNQNLASSIALAKYDELYNRVKNGGRLNTVPFSKLYEEWSKYWMATSTQKYEDYKVQKITNVGNYPLKYFTTVKNDMGVNEINDNIIAEYFIWRKQNSYNHVNGKKYIPAATTINNEIVSLNHFFEYGKSKGYLTDKPVMKRASLTGNRRPTFTPQEMKTIYKCMRERVKTSPANVERDRFYLQKYFLILANTGMRVGEFRGLKWEHLKTLNYNENGKVEKRLILTIDGKTGRRESVSNKGTETYFKDLFDYRSKELKEVPPTNEYVLCHPDGKFIRSFKGSFNNLLKSIDLTYDSFGRKRTVYSLRHYFATMRLEAEVSPYLLAQNIGSSVEMLRKHYGQIVTSRVASELSKTKQNINVKKNTKDYPFD
jgi:integrase